MKQRLILGSVISTLCLANGLAWFTPAWADPPKQNAPNAEDQRIAAVLNLKAKLNLVRTFGFSSSIPSVERPRELTETIEQLEKVLETAKRWSPELSEKVRETVLLALQILYKGRGETAKGDGTGWYPTNKNGNTGLREIKSILGRGLLDEEGKRAFKEFVQDYDFNSRRQRQVLALPTWSASHTPLFKDAVLDAIERAPDASDRANRPPIIQTAESSGHTVKPDASSPKPTLRELVQEQVDSRRITERQAKMILSFSETVENNLYNKSVEAHNDPKKRFIEYFGRDTETKEMIDALSKIEKGHVLLTGKAGVGKTTILQILSDAFVQGKLSIHDEKPPIILELPITKIMNQLESDEAIANARLLSDALRRRVILYVDEAHVSSNIVRQTLKGYLTRMVHDIGNKPGVNLVWSTTSSEARDFFNDSAFSRRWSMVHVDEFDRDNTIKLIKKSSVPMWKKEHHKSGVTFDGIEEDAFDYAYRFGPMEQRHAGNPTGTKELLEAAITRRMNDLAEKGVHGPFTLSADDVRDYISSKLKMPLVPGDPHFDEKFEKIWGGLRDEYGGNDGAASEVKRILKDHFSSFHKAKMTAVAAFGPPGGGKSFLAESIAKHYFNGALLTLNGGEYSEQHEKSKLLGSPPGYVGHNEQRSVLTKFFTEHPGGGLIKIEEADYMHSDVMNLLVNAITEKKFTDGLGNEYDTSRFILWKNTNIGQDLMIPKDAANKMNWDQYYTRRAALTERVLVDGKPVERIKESKMSELFDQFVGQMITKSKPGQDTSLVSQEALKQKRRYRGIYILPPDRQELVEAAHRRVQKFIRDSKTDHGVNFEISPESVDKALDVEHYPFEKGYSYVEEQLQEKLFGNLSAYFGDRGRTIKAHIEDTQIELDDHTVPAQNLVVETSDGKSEKFTLGATIHEEKNPWGSNPETLKRIQNFPEEMGKHLKGNHDIVADMASVLKSKSVNWNEKAVFTLLGTSGNGKTETAKAMAKVLYGDENALFTITGVNNPWDLNTYFRPATGIEGAKDETQFERWFKSRKSAGGGVILFDELMSSISEKSSATMGGQKGGKIAVLQELYHLLDEQKIKIAGKYEDARGFVTVITGNSLQELFTGLEDNPETEALVKQIRDKLTRSDVVAELEKHGLDAPKIARLGHIHVLGPQPRAISMDVGNLKVQNAVELVRKALNKPDLEIVIPKEATQAVVDRLSTVQLGMREVDNGFNTLIIHPLETMLADFVRIKKIRVKKIEMKLPDGEHPQWFVNGEEVRLEGKPLADGGEKRSWEFKRDLGPGAIDRTPTVHNLNSVEKLKYTPELLHEVAVHEVYGHWMTNAMLSRENGADFVSLIPGKSSLGYVRPKAQEVADVENLSSILKRMVELSAGHRAVFYHGNYATGGGNNGSARTAGKEATDDLGKIEKLKNVLINNRMLPGITEASSPEEKAFVGRLLDNVVDRMADEVIHKGIESKQFQPVFDQVMKDRYLKKETLEELLKKVDFKKFGYHGKDALFMETISASIAKELENRKGDIHFEQAKKFSSGMLSRTFEESLTRAAHDPSAVAELNEIKAAVVATVKEGKLHPRMQLQCITRELEEMLF